MNVFKTGCGGGRIVVTLLIAALGALVCACASKKIAVSPPQPSTPTTQTAAAQRQEELWVFARSEPPPKPGASAAGPGELRTGAEGNRPESPLPLRRTDVRAIVTGYLGTVDVTQQFFNPSTRTLDAVYVFSLPPNAAVSEFLMTMGTRHIRGIVRERVEAEDIYRQARSQGRTASLLTGDAAGVYRQSITNIAPGGQIDVSIQYYQVLSYSNGWYEFVFPLTAPRGPASPERNGRDLTLRIDLNAGAAIEEAASLTHKIVRESHGPNRLTVALAPAERISSADFMLRYRVAGGRIAMLPDAIQKLVKQHGLSAWTAMLAVDSVAPAPGREER